MPSNITMPQLSDTMTEGTVIKWHTHEGEAVKAGQELADVETDKATMPMEAFESGTLAYIAAPEGQKVHVGGLLGVIALSGEDAQQVKRDAQSAVPLQPPPPLVATEPQTPPPPPQSATVPEPSEHLRVSPLARRIAADRNVDLAHVPGSGPAGRIVQRDVLAYLDQGAPKSPPPPRTTPLPPAPILLTGQKKTVPLTKMRSAIAAALLRSKQTIPHYYEAIDIDMEAASDLRQRLNQRLENDNIHLSIADLIIKAVASCLTQYPALNARFNAEKGEITQFGDVNLGLAVAIPDGLIVPVLRGVNQLGLRDIRIRSADLIDRARLQRLRRDELSDATFTITNLGTHGLRHFAAIINPPEVAILAVGAAEKRPVVLADQIVPRLTLTATLSADHRVVDGALAAEFLATLKSTLQDPGLMLL